MRFSHAKFLLACLVSILLSAVSLTSAGDDSDALLVVEISVPILLVALVSVVLLEKRYGVGA